MLVRFSLVLAFVLSACNAIESNQQDAAVTPPRDVVMIDAIPPDVFVDSGCPAAPRVPPDMVPAHGFLAPVHARFARAVDGDTAHFVIPITGDIDVRLLWVNTEESHAPNPADNTAFGVATGLWAMRTMPTVTDYTLVFEEDPRHAGQPNLDPYMRRLALVFADGDLWQTRLVREGWSAYYTDFGCAPDPIHTALLDAEAEARANQRGIWTPAHPTNYADVFAHWITTRCRPNPFRMQPYCMP